MGFLTDWLARFYYDEDLERTDAEVERRLHEMNVQRLEEGFWDEDDYALAEGHLRVDHSSTYFQQVVDEADAGLEEGWNNVTSGIRDTINAPARFLWDSIPWWVWLLGIAALAWYLGLFSLLQRRIAKA